MSKKAKEGRLVVKQDNNVVSNENAEKWNRLAKLFKETVTRIMEIGILVADLLENDPKAEDVFKRKGIPEKLYRKWEMIGKGQLIPELIEYDEFSHLDSNTQKRIVHEKISAKVFDSYGNEETVMVDILKAPPSLKRQIIGPKGIRSAEEQIEYLKQKKEASKKKFKSDSTIPWKYTSEGLEIYAPCKITNASLKMIFSQMMPS